MKTQEQQVAQRLIYLNSLFTDKKVDQVNIRSVEDAVYGLNLSAVRDVADMLGLQHTRHLNSGSLLTMLTRWCNNVSQQGEVAHGRS
jgi:hypothetical protein